MSIEEDETIESLNNRLKLQLELKKEMENKISNTWKQLRIAEEHADFLKPRRHNKNIKDLVIGLKYVHNLADELDYERYVILTIEEKNLQSIKRKFAEGVSKLGGTRPKLSEYIKYIEDILLGYEEVKIPYYDLDWIIFHENDGMYVEFHEKLLSIEPFF